MKYEPVTYKIYRLIDPSHSPEHENYVRYIGMTFRTIEERFQEHCNEHQYIASNSGANWFDFSALKPQLVELAGTRDRVKWRERYWVELHRKAGYNLLNVSLMKEEMLPEGFKSPPELRKF